MKVKRLINNKMTKPLSILFALALAKITLDQSILAENLHITK